jgi:hypothetical protein
MAMGYWGSPVALDEIDAVYPRESGHGFKAGALRDFARTRGLAAYVVSGRLIDIQLELEKRRPVIVGLQKRYPKRFLSHYEVVVGIHPKQKRIATLDPARGWRENTWNGFLAEWRPARQLTLIMFNLGEPPPTAASTNSEMVRPDASARRNAGR